MKTYRIEVSSTVLIEAENDVEAREEFMAEQDETKNNGGNLINDLMINATIEKVEIEPEFQE